MTFPKPFTTSERYARLLLTAWDNHEVTEFQAILKRINFAGRVPLSFAERERMDLILDIASSLPLWKSSGQSEYAENSEAALNLMRHLARWNEGASEGDATKRKSLPAGMPAAAPSSRCVPRWKARHSRFPERALAGHDRI
jgi:hypothetical protein